MASCSPLRFPSGLKRPHVPREQQLHPEGLLTTRPGPVLRARSPAERMTLPLASDQQLCLKAEPSAFLQHI